MSSSSLGDNDRAGLMGRLPGILASLIWWLLLLALVLLALYVGIGRQLTQNIDNFRVDIQQRLSSELGHDVAIGRLESRWQWLDPILEAHDIQVRKQQDGEPLGALRYLRVRLDTLESLKRFRLVFASFDADRLDMTVSHVGEGELEVKGAELPEPRANRIAHWIDLAGTWLSDPSVRITRVNLGIRDARGNMRYVDIPQLDLLYRGGMFYASGRAMRSGTNEQLASFRLLGQHFFRGDFNGQLYMDVNSGRHFDGMLEDFRWRGLGVEALELGGQTWLTFREGKLDYVTGILETPYLQVGTKGATIAPLENIRALIGWRRTDPDASAGDGALQNGELHIKEIGWEWMGETVSPFSLAITSGSPGYQLAGDGLALEAIARLTNSLDFLPSAAHQALDGYAPAGQLNRWRLAIPGPGERSFALAGTLSGVDVRAHRGAPGIRDLDGRIKLDNRGGFVEVDSQEVTLGFPELFSGAWTLDRMQAVVAWSLEDGLTRVYSDDIVMDYHETTVLSGGFDLRLEEGKPGNLGLQVKVSNGDASMLADFVPAKIVDPGLYQWLTTAIIQADIEAGTYFGHGPIGRNAPPGAFVSSMWYRFSEGTVRYDERWPEITGADGRVTVHNGRTRVDLQSGLSGGLELAPSQVLVEPGEPAATVYVNTAAEVPGGQVPYWMKNSPLGELAGAAGTSLLLEGTLGLDLSLILPLAENAEPGVNASLAANGARAVYPDAELAWENVTGTLTFDTDTGFSAEPLQAQFMDDPVEIRFSRSESGEAMTIGQTGELQIADLFRRSGLDADASGLGGSFRYQARLDVAPDSASDLSFQSDLAGLSVALPEPLAKEADQVTPLRATLKEDGDSSLILSGHWDERMAFRLAWQDNAFQRGRIALQATDTPLPERPGLRISGPLESLDLTTWQEALSPLAAESATLADETEVLPDYSDWLDGIDLQVGEFLVLGQNFSNVQVDARPDSGSGWQVDVASEAAEGSVTVPVDSSSPILLGFSTLRLTREEEAGEVAAEKESTTEEQGEVFGALALEQWPDFDIRIENLYLNQEPLGRWSLQLRPEAGRLQVNALRGDLGDLSLEGEMSWSVLGSREVSRFKGAVQGGGLSALGPLLGAEIPFRNDSTAIELDLDWPGDPGSFSLKNLNGEVSLRLDDGVILEQNNTAQLFRVFNLLNSDTLWRRLRFDFSDLYEAGVAFDAISGKASITEGLLTWSPELQVVGPSGAFRLSGTTDMADEILNMQLVVVLPLTQNLPLAALLLGAGAPIGGALFVLDKILGDPLSKLTSATYSVEGSWDNPEVELQRVFDTGGS